MIQHAAGQHLHVCNEVAAAGAGSGQLRCVLLEPRTGGLEAMELRTPSCLSAGLSVIHPCMLLRVLCKAWCTLSTGDGKTGRRLLATVTAPLWTHVRAAVECNETDGRAKAPPAPLQVAGHRCASTASIPQAWPEHAPAHAVGRTAAASRAAARQARPAHAAPAPALRPAARRSWPGCHQAPRHSAAGGFRRAAGPRAPPRAAPRQPPSRSR